MPDVTIRVVCPYCANSLQPGETICPACQEDLAVLVKLAYEHVILYNEGLVLARQGQLVAAEERLLQSIAQRMDFAPSHRVLAKVYAREENWGKARDAAARALELNPDSEDGNALYEAIAQHLPAESVAQAAESVAVKRRWWRRRPRRV